MTRAVNQPHRIVRLVKTRLPRINLIWGWVKGRKATPDLRAVTLIDTILNLAGIQLRPGPLHAAGFIQGQPLPRWNDSAVI